MLVVALCAQLNIFTRGIVGGRGAVAFGVLITTAQLS